MVSVRFHQTQFKMAASYELIFLIFICIHSTLNQVVGAVEQNVLLSHVTTKGSLVAKLPWESGQKSEIVSVLGSDLFQLKDGEVLTTKDLSELLHQTLPLVIKHELGTHKWFDTLHVKITKTSPDNNHDQAPTFSSCEYAVTVDYADVIGGGTILSIPATYAHGNTIHYVLKPDDVFDVDNKGNIFAKNPAQVIAKEYVLELVANDSSDRTSIPVRITITVAGELKFVTHRRVRRQIQQSAAVSVYENETTVYTFETISGNSPFYEIVSSTIPGMFRMVGQSIVTASGRRLDYEQKDQRSITVVVNITVGNELTESRTIQITVNNVNDEAPYFITKPEPYLATVSLTAQEGETVFTLMAKDPDEPLSRIEYYLMSGAEGRFMVELDTGKVNVVGSTTFERNKEYFVYVEARDVNSSPPFQRTPQKAVQIRVGERAPQIFEPRYDVDVPEETNVPYLVETIKARRFQNAELRYSLQNNVGRMPNAFTITSDGQEGGEVKLMQTLDYESQTQPREYRLRVIVSEMSSSLSSTAQLIISVIDINDHDPRFPLSTYIRRDVSEDALVGIPLLNVTAVDQDSGRNAELTFSVSNPLFAADTVGSTGIIKVNGRLDYDRTRGHRYEFQVIAMDNGESPRSGSATVIVLVTNVNDEDPEFSTDLKAEVLENANVDQFVHTVHVTDPDGDNVKVYFKDTNNGGQAMFNGPFGINPETGRVYLRQTLPRGRLHYVLNLTAEDDGSCCGTPGVKRTSEAALIVEVMDINDNRPEFPNCTQYQNNPPSVKENSDIGSPVFQVKAVDLDQGDNGKIRYDFLLATTQNTFRINSTTGLITVIRQIDREATDGARDIGITVQASDHGTPQLNGICSFRVLVEDVNDHNPVFTESVYKATVRLNSKADTSVTRVVANDDDSGENRRVEYSLVDNPSGLFKVNSQTGIIRLAVDLTVTTNQIITVMAQDHGTPVRRNSTAIVNVTVQANLVRPPEWQGSVANNTPININETHPLVHTKPIARLQATTEGGGQVDFLFITNNQTAVSEIDPFVIYRPPGLNDIMHIYLKSTLDYERTESYQLRIRAAANRANSDIIVTIAVQDQNDEAPVFRGYNPIALTINGILTENRPPPQTVVTLQAIDADKSEEFRRLRYSFLDGSGAVARNFSIDEDTGVITTRTTFDLEAFPQGVIRFTVKVDDRVPSVDPIVPEGYPNSATATVEVVIQDENDNEPRFAKRLWQAEVAEDVDIGHPVLTLSALDDDKDSMMEYSIISAGNDFTVEPRSGIVRVANLLDFDDPNRRLYNLTVQVYDGVFTDTAQMFINVSDANDNDPVFSENPYVVLNITEESDDFPKVIIKVLATDPDTERPNDIEYSLNGPLAEDNSFRVDRKTGEITLLRRLDRDLPDGQEVFEFNVLAVDEPRSQNKRTGVSFVRVKPIDINDNPPRFDKNLIEGTVPEHTVASGPGSTVFAVNAVDYDAGENARVEYNIISVDSVNGVPLFGIDRSSGQIFVSIRDETVLDRETQDTYSLVVQAKDKGTPTPLSSNQTITIRLSDKNDQVPVFSQSIYRVSMSENLPKGASIISVTASDQDIGINAQLIYSLETTQDKGYFYIDTRNETNEGILRVFESNKIDFENEATKSFNVTVSVDDVPSPSHKVLAYIEVTVEDFNDNAPQFEQESIQKTVLENITVGTSLGTFKATDADSGDNKIFEYYIDHSPDSDPDRQFTINENGVVSVNKPLDRETKESHDVNILAIDKGTPPKTGTAVLLITVQDVNDNAPRFAKDYVVYFEEEVEEIQQWPELIEAEDPDIASNGPPFYFTLPCNYACPCAENPTCDSFNMTFKRSPDKPNGFARIFTMYKRFDRETQKEYQMPIVMWDSGEPVMTGTNMLQIVIKDKNDNEHEPGLKEIFVYSYEGFSALENVKIGRVYAKDPDDWDVVDKQYSVVGTIPEYFSVDQHSGMVAMSGKPPEGTYSFKVAVYDSVFDKSHNSEVQVIVKGIPAEAVYSSGSVRLTGITAQEFLERPHVPNGGFGQYEKSKFDKMKTELAEKLGVPESNVDIFSVREGKGHTDVRFAAHGSPWYKPSKLDGLVLTNKAEFEKNVGVTVGMVPIDECLYEICDHGCHNTYIVSDQPLVVYANTTSFVGVNAYYESECNYCNGTDASSCTCKASEFPTECRGDFCYNGGTCYIDYWNEIRCKCEEGFDGPRCQQTKHSFSGKGWALYPALAQCEFGRTSLEFITQQQNCLLFYNGPDDDSGQNDFISLQLRDGAPVLNIDHGTGVLTLTVANQNLADNKWHRIDITSEGKVITLTVDDCKSAVITENERVSSEDRSSCESSGRTPGENMYLNVNTLLQMGGTISDPVFLQPRPPDFSGCIKNFRHLGMLYDLHIGKTGLHEGTRDGCPQEEDSCGSVNAVDGLVCGINGICEGVLGGGAPSCICKPGWMGDKCSQETPTKDFLDESFLVWMLLYNPSVNRNKIQLRFRSRDKDGVLFAVMSDSREQFIQLEIRNHVLQLAYHLGSSVQQSLRLGNVVASNGQWHTAYVERSGKRFKLYMDSGEGPYYTETKGMKSGYRTLQIDPGNVFGGALVSGNVIQNPEITDYESSCMSDVRLDGRWFPMVKQESSNAAQVIEAQNLRDGCTRNDCKNNSCPAERQCVPLWEKFDCKCWPGYVESKNLTCVSACRCKNGGTCMYTATTELGYYCVCPREYTGTHCETHLGSLVHSAELSVEGLVAILVCLFLFLLLVLAVFLYIKLRKPKEKIMMDDDPYDDIRENIIHYDEDGAGEEDQNAFDISRIRVPLDGAVSMKTPYEDPQRRTDRPLQSALPPGETPDVGNFIEGRLKDADEDLGAPPHDSVREFAHEGGGSDAGSLSSLNTSTSSGDQDYDYLNDWGPKFAKLADMYGAGQADDD